jgi:RHS repeat-associated protein
VNQSGRVGLFGLVPGREDAAPGVNVLTPPQTVVSTTVPISALNTNTGNHVLEYRDHIYPGDGLRFSFIRYYNSLDPYSGPLGPGWMHSYNVFVVKNSEGEVLYKDADGREVRYKPGGSGTYVSVTKGNFDILTSDVSGYILTKTNGNELAFGTDGKLRSITAETGEIIRFGYDAAGRLTTITDPDGRLFTLAYQAGLLKSVSDGTSTLATYEYTSGFLTAYVDVFGGRTEYAYEAGRLKSARQPSGVRTFTNTFTGNKVGQQLNASGKITRLSYDAGPSTATGPACSGSSLTRITDALSRTTAHYFDANLRLICVTDALGGVTRYTYDENNNRTSITDPNGNTTRFEYDGRGNLLTRTDALNQTARDTYDLSNHLLTSSNGRGNTISYAYDARGNRIREVDALGNVTQYEYDSNGNRTAVTDASLRTTRFSYYPGTRLLHTVTDPLGGQTTYTYDASGNRTSVTNPNGNYVLYCYDRKHRLTTIIDPPGPGGTPTCNSTPYYSYAYDTLGNLISFTNGNGEKTTTAYDESNRPEEVVYNFESKVVYTYDAVGNRLSMKDSDGTTIYTYDALNRMTSATRPPAGAVRYEYDPASNRIRTVYPDGKVVIWEYDNANRLARAVDWSSRATNYRYDGAGNVVAVDTTPAISTGFTFDNANRLNRVTNTFKSGSEKDSVAITSFTYTLDVAGNRISVRDGSGLNTTYTYDGLSQLISASEGSDTTVWAYEPAGNRIRARSDGATVDGVYTAENVLKRWGSVVYDNDREGNRIREKSLTGAVLSEYTYDAAGRLVKVVGPAGTTTFAYDGDGNRTRKVVNGVVTEYTNDVGAPLVVVLQEKTGADTTSYLWGRSLIFADNPAFEHYYVYDGLSSVVGVIGPDGVRRQTYRYGAWGQVKGVVPPGGSGDRNPYRFTGEAQDASTGLLYLRTRYYDPVTGRFISPDRYFSYPRLPLSLNKFVYVRNNPVRYIDRTGRDPFPDSIDPAIAGSDWPFSPPWP